MNIKLVTYTEQYLDKSFEWLNDPDIIYLLRSQPVNRENQRQWFLSLPNRMDYKIWGIEGDGLPIGACGFKQIENGVGTLFCYIGEKNLWGGGIGTILMNLMEEKAKKLGLSTIKLKVKLDNIRAQALYKKFGFVQYDVDEFSFYMIKR